MGCEGEIEFFPTLLAAEEKTVMEFVADLDQPSTNFHTAKVVTSQ